MSAVDYNTPVKQECSAGLQQCEVGAEDDRPLELQRPHIHSPEVYAPALRVAVKVEHDAEDADPLELLAGPARAPCETVTSTPHTEQTLQTYDIPIKWEVGADGTDIKEELDIGSTVILPLSTSRLQLAPETVTSSHSSSANACSTSTLHNNLLVPPTASTSRSEQLKLSELSFISDMSHALSYERTPGNHKANTQEQHDVGFSFLPTALHIDTSERKNETLFKSEHSEYTESNDNYLQNHTDMQTGQKLYKCEHCHYCTPYNSHFIEHMRKHTGDKPFKCVHCNYSASRYSCLQRHIRKHTGEKPYKCEHCNYSASQRSDLQIHMRAHTGEKPYKCEHCNYSTSQRTCLLRHRRTHTGDKPYKCEHCNYSASQRSSLQIHIRIHTGDKPFKCEHCSYSASRRCYLRTHIRRHTGDKPYKCNHCKYRASQYNSLQRHLRLHNVVKLYKCDHCVYGASELSLLRRHMQKHTS